MVITGDDSRWPTPALLLCSCGWRQRARVSRSRALARPRSTFLWIASERIGWKVRAAHECQRDGGALHKRDARVAARRTLPARRSIVGWHDRVRDGLPARSRGREGGLAGPSRHVSGRILQTLARLLTAGSASQPSSSEVPVTPDQSPPAPCKQESCLPRKQAGLRARESET